VDKITKDMERNEIYAYAVAFIVLAVLLIIAVSEYYTIASLNDQLSLYKKQQREFSRIVTAEYLGDMEAARHAWITSNQRDHVSLQNQGISVEADSIKTQGFTIVLDLQDPSMTRVDSMHGDIPPGEAVVYLGQYYQDNMTRVPGWEVSYTVNTTTHAVSGLTPLLIQNVAYQYYTSVLAPGIYANLGVANGSVTGFNARSIDSSYLPDSGNWLEVSEYRYTLKYSDLKPYLLVKTYVNASDESVASVDISKPYYDSVTGINL
jgi:hypothetical protein